MDDVLLVEVLDRPGDQQINVGAFHSHQGFGPHLFELVLHLGEHQLDRVELALIFHVVYGFDLQLLELGLDLLASMHSQVIHKNTYLLVRMSFSDHVQVLAELGRVDRLVVDPPGFDAVLRRDAHQQGLGLLIQHSFVYLSVLIFGRPHRLEHSLPEEYRLVQVHD